MKRERCYRQRGKEVCLVELTGLVALHRPPAGETTPTGSEKGPGRRARPDRARLTRQALDDLAPEVSLPQVRAFEDAGWVFAAASEHAESGPDAARAKVFVSQGGRLALGTNRLFVQLHGDPSERQADELLRPHGCRVLEKLSFAPGLFRVELTARARGDALDVANELPAAGVCKFAEPELIEMTGAR